MPHSILIGTHTYAAAGDAARRQANGVGSLLALRGVAAANVQFAREPHRAAGLETIERLTQDSTTVTGRQGPRRPVIREIFDVLAREAAARGHAYFCFTNADIIWAQHAVEWIRAGAKQGWVFSRQDFDGRTGAETRIELSGADVFAVATAVWPRIRSRFRNYLVGQTCWDNVYASVLMTHADAAIENRRGLVRHEEHPSQALATEPYAAYIRLLAALDARYFHLWCTYWDRLRLLREHQAPEEAEVALARETFVWPPSVHERAMQTGRSLKARLRYILRQR
jgi:hypothetical protein